MIRKTWRQSSEEINMVGITWNQANGIPQHATTKTLVIKATWTLNGFFSVSSLVVFCFVLGLFCFFHQYIFKIYQQLQPVCKKKT